MKEKTILDTLAGRCAGVWEENKKKKPMEVLKKKEPGLQIPGSHLKSAGGAGDFGYLRGQKGISIQRTDCSRLSVSGNRAAV